MIARALRTAAIALGLALPICAPALALPPPGQIQPNPPIANPPVNTGPINGTVKLSIPVNLVQIPSGIMGFSVQCSFRYVAGGWGNGTESNHVDVPLESGSYNQTVSETLTLQSSTAAMINGYQCNLYLYPAGGSGAIPSVTNANPALQPRPNTPFVVHVEGGF